jgi:hypothetical protein
MENGDFRFWTHLGHCLKGLMDVDQRSNTDTIKSTT